MENDALASSGAETPDQDRVRPAEAPFVARALWLLKMVGDRMRNGPPHLPAVWLDELDEIFHRPEMAGALSAVSDHFEKIVVIARRCGYVRKLEPLLVGRERPHEATAPTEAKP
jgi:hypothetical protein